MKTKRLIINALFLLSFGLTGLHAQEAFSAAGGNAGGTEGFASYTTGQVFYITYTGIDGSVAEGIQQPYDESGITAVGEKTGITLEISVFPNPVADNLVLTVEHGEPATLTFQLRDVKGNLVRNKIITDRLTIIEMGTLASSTYFLTVMQHDIPVKTFEIVKTR